MLSTECFVHFSNISLSTSISTSPSNSIFNIPNFYLPPTLIPSLLSIRTASRLAMGSRQCSMVSNVVSWPFLLLDIFAASTQVGAAKSCMTINGIDAGIQWTVHSHSLTCNEAVFMVAFARLGLWMRCGCRCSSTHSSPITMSLNRSCTFYTARRQSQDREKMILVHRPKAGPRSPLVRSPSPVRRSPVLFKAYAGPPRSLRHFDT